MNTLTNFTTLFLLSFILFSCGNTADSNSSTEQEDDGSGNVVKRMGIETPRNIDYAPSAFHTTNINTILFTSNLNLNPETAKATDFKTDFKAGEVIKGIAYLDQTASEKFGADGFPILKYSVGKRKHKWTIESYRKYDQQLQFLEFFISVPLDQYIPTKGGASTIANSMEELSKLSNQSFPLAASLLTSEGRSTGIEGSIEYDATQKKSAADLSKEIKAIRIKHVNAIPLPTAKMQDKTIEDQLVEHFNDMGWNEKFGKTIILSDEFQFKKSHTGIIVAKTLSVAMVSKNPEGYCMYQVFTVIADKTDEGYSKFKRYSTGDQYACTCNW